MRTLKFRAWDIDHKQFIHFDLNDPDAELFGRHGILADTVIEPWQQFTGLTDSKGKEIYEGDIIKYFNRYGEKQKINPVVFDLGMFCINDDDIYVKLSQANRVEVIGNIYENPELLKENL